MSTQTLDWQCSQCGGAGTVAAQDDASFKSVMVAVENEHAAQSPECPYDRAHLLLEVWV